MIGFHVIRKTEHFVPVSTLVHAQTRQRNRKFAAKASDYDADSKRSENEKEPFEQVFLLDPVD